MKNKSKYLLAMVLICSMAINIPCFAIGWNSGTTAAQAQAQNAQTGYVFRSGETVLQLGTEADAVLAKLGAPVKVFEQDSCAYQGKDRVYTFPGFELSVYPDGGKNLISDIYIPETSTAATPEGIHPGSTVDEMIKVYGSAYTEKWGVYRYTQGNCILMFYTTGNKIDVIEYQLTAQK